MGQRSRQARHALKNVVQVSLLSLTLGVAYVNCSEFETQSRSGLQRSGEFPTGSPTPAPSLTPRPTPRIESKDFPAWLQGHALNEWFQIPNTAGAGGATVYAYSGMAVNDEDSEIYIAAAGGHLDGSDNRVVSIRLDQDEPKWIQRHATTPVSVRKMDVPYYLDGLPSSRHLWYTIHYIPQLHRVMLIGNRGAYGNAYTFKTIDGFDLNTNKWDAAGTWKDGLGLGHALNKATGDVWSAVGTRVLKWSASTGEQVQTLTVASNIALMPAQNAWDPVRNQLLSIGFGDGWGSGTVSQLFAYKIDAAGTTIMPITFNPSPALTQLMAERPVRCAFEYDPDHDRFLYFGGLVDGGRVYVITPNSGNVWDISLLALGAGSQNPPVSLSAGVFSRLRYVPKFKGFVYLHAGSWQMNTNLYFIRTAE